MNKLRILLADDHQVVREGLRTLLNMQPDMEVVGEAENGKEACQKAKELQPDVVIMDISMPSLNGMQATESLKQTCPKVKVVVLSAYEDSEYLRQILRLGASGYLLKNTSVADVAHAIRCAMNGGVYLDPTMAGKVVSGYLHPHDPHGAQSTQTGDELPPIALSGREIEVLRLLAWGHTNKEIAAQLHISIHTVETYKARSMEKLELENRADVVRYAVRRGWLSQA